ncbi:MAG: NAD(P)-binding domain-containing protein [Bacteroidota bacterium]
MKIAIIGTGKVGGSLARGWARAGHDILLGVRDTQNFKGQELLTEAQIRAVSIPDAVTEAEVVLIATPAQVVLELIKQWGSTEAKVWIDATNAIAQSPQPYPTAYHALADRCAGAVVKCFNTTGYENMRNPRYGEARIDLFMAGAHAEAKGIARRLALDLGFAECYDFGGADKVELLEQFALAWINLAIMQGMGRNIGFQLLRR